MIESAKVIQIIPAPGWECVYEEFGKNVAYALSGFWLDSNGDIGSLIVGGDGFPDYEPEKTVNYVAVQHRDYPIERVDVRGVQSLDKELFDDLSIEYQKLLAAYERDTGRKWVYEEGE